MTFMNHHTIFLDPNGINLVLIAVIRKTLESYMSVDSFSIHE